MAANVRSISKSAKKRRQRNAISHIERTQKRCSFLWKNLPNHYQSKQMFVLIVVFLFFYFAVLTYGKDGGAYGDLSLFSQDNRTE